MEAQKRSYILAIIVVFIWATVASAFKISLQFMDFLQLLFYASATSVVVLTIVLLVQKKLVRLIDFTRTDFLRSLLLGFLNPFLYYIVLFKAYSILPAQQAVSLNYTWPINITILSIPLLKQKVKPLGIAAILISYFGVVMVSTRGNINDFKFTEPFGIFLALGSAVIWAVYWILNIQDRRDPVLRLFLNFIAGFIFISAICLLTHRIVVPPKLSLFGAVYVGIFEMGVTFIIWLYALKLSKTTAQVANFIYLTPFLSLLIINIVLQERILVSTMVGLFLIISGIIIQQFSKNR